MGHLRTSANFYYRGLPKTATNFAGVALGNYSIIQPMRSYIGIGSYLKRSMNSFKKKHTTELE